MRSSKDLAKRLRFDRFPRPDRFRRSYALLGIVAMLAGVGGWFLLNRTMHDRQYLPGPVSQAHATFGDRCDNCHDQFHSVRNEACLKCHEVRVHSEFEPRTPHCAECHVEHRGGQTLLALSNANCVDCHRQLVTKRSPAIIQAEIPTFAAHPTFAPLRAGQTDRAALRFNHRIHLTSDKIAKADTLSCASCHQPNKAGTLMLPIRFEPHCKRCHKQELQGPTGSIEALHKSPDVVRADLIAQLLVVGIRDADAIFAPAAPHLPGRRAEVIDDSHSLREYQERWLAKFEDMLYRPFQEPPSVIPKQGLLELNKYCFLCHFPGAATEGDQRVSIAATHVPRKWLLHADFSHRRHELIACKECHASAVTSELTTDINLPDKERCTRCHVDETLQSAGIACVACHLYHDTSKNGARRVSRRRVQPIDVLTGKTQPGDVASAGETTPRSTATQADR